MHASKAGYEAASISNARAPKSSQLPTSSDRNPRSTTADSGISNSPEHPSASARTILLVGETGSGKSTFINYLANYFLVGDLRRLKVVVPTRYYRHPTEEGYALHSEANLDDPTVSQTSKCATYSFQKDGITYNFVDTPGLSDTSDSAFHQVDNETVDKILETAGQLKMLQAIILTINGSIPKLTPNLRNALQRIAGNFPDALRDNLLVIFTNSFMKNPNFDLDSLPSAPKQFFTMNNSAFSSPHDQWDEEEAGIQEKYWKMTMKKVGDMLVCINGLTPQSAQAIEGIRDNRSKIKKELMQAVTDIQSLQKLVEKCEGLKREEEISQQKISHEQMTASYQLREVESLREKERILETDAQASTAWESELRNSMQVSSSSLEEAFRNTRMHMDILGSQKAEARSVEDFEMLVQLADKCLQYRSQIRDFENSYRAQRERNFHTQQALEDVRTEKKTAKVQKTDTGNRLVARRGEKDQIQASRQQVEAELLEANQRLTNAKEEVERKCRELKAVCEKFNFAAELAPARDALMNSLRTLSSPESRKRARDFVDHLNHLAYDDADQQASQNHLGNR